MDNGKILPYQHIVITGASSGIGAALALFYARMYRHARLSLHGRNSDRLQTIVCQCLELGADVSFIASDIMDNGTLAQWLHEQDQIKPIDLIIANAGISGGPQDDIIESVAQTSRIFDTNFYGVIHTVFPLLPKMIDRRHGHIVLMSSLAGYCGMASAPSYSVSKMAVRAYGDALRGQLAPKNITVTVICPGFIKTPMTDINEFEMPFLMTPEDAAQKIAHGIERKKAVVAFPFPLYALTRIMASLPGSVRDMILQRLPAKKAMHH